MDLLVPTVPIDLPDKAFERLEHMVENYRTLGRDNVSGKSTDLYAFHYSGPYKIVLDVVAQNEAKVEFYVRGVYKKGLFEEREITKLWLYGDFDLEREDSETLVNYRWFDWLDLSNPVYKVLKHELSPFRDAVLKRKIANNFICDYQGNVDRIKNENLAEAEEKADIKIYDLGLEDVSNLLGKKLELVPTETPVTAIIAPNDNQLRYKAHQMNADALVSFQAGSSRATPVRIIR
ncbi:hypothetical protein K8R33_05080 [archaeon]|nr:hypothetical protein [archaeon]